jgi:hypothetical protein
MSWRTVFNGFTSSGDLEMTRETAEETFENRIIPASSIRGDPPVEKTFVLVGGHQGSAKTTTILNVEMGLPGATEKIIPDHDAAHVPRFDDRARTHPTIAMRDAQRAGARYFTRAKVKRARDMGANIIHERANPEGSAAYAAEFKGLGYRTELRLKGTPHCQSWTAIFDRAEDALSKGNIGTNAVVSRESHDKFYAGWARAVFDAETYMHYDRIVIESRDGEVVYDNHLVTQPDGTKKWAKEPRALDYLLRERHRAITKADARRTKATWRRIVQSPHMSADANLESLPLAEHAAEIQGLVDSEGSRFDAHGRNPGKFSDAAEQQSRQRILADLDRTRRSSGKVFGYSREFAERIQLYADSLVGLAGEHYNASDTTYRFGDMLGRLRSSKPTAAGGTKRGLDQSAITGATSGPSTAFKRRRLNERSRDREI